MAYRDYYQVLEVSRPASQEAIQQAYRNLARKYHPDLNKEPGAEDRFKAIGEAYDVLKDPEKRALYDRYGEAWKAVSEGRAPPPGSERAPVDFGDAGFDANQFHDFGSIFDVFFGSAAASRGTGAWSTSRRPMAGMDHEATLELTVQEAFRGGERELRLSTRSMMGDGRAIRVRVPPAVRDGQRIRIPGKGGPGGDDGPSGDLYLRVRIKPEGPFRLEGRDVYTTLAVSPWEAALGTPASLPTLDGVVRVRVPQGSSSGRKIRLRGKGYGPPTGPRGDLYAEVRVEVPRELTENERDLLEKLAQTSHFCPRPEDASRSGERRR